MAALSPTGFHLGLLNALNLSLPTDAGRAHQTLAKEAVAEKASQTFGKSPDTAATHLQTEPGAPRSLLPLDRFIPRPDLSPPVDFGCPGDDYIDSYVEDSRGGAGYMSHSAAQASRFVPMPRKTSHRNRFSPHEAKAMAPPPMSAHGDQSQQGGQCWPKEARKEQRLFKQINKQQQQKQQQLQDQRRRKREAEICAYLGVSPLQ